MLPERIKQRYRELNGELLCVELEKERQGLGLSLAGNRDRSRLSIFVVGLNPGGAAAKDGSIRVGDELLEINNQVLYGHSHHNASAIIKSAATKVHILLLRNEDAIQQMAVPPFPNPPPVFSSNELTHQQSISPVVRSQHAIEKAPPSPEALLLSVAPAENTALEASKLSSGRPELVSDHSAPKSLEEGDVTSKTLNASGVKELLESVSQVAKTPMEQQVSVSLSTMCGSSNSGQPTGPSERAVCFPDSQCSSTEPATCPIVPGQETVIEIAKGRSGLGLSIVGGKDTQLDAIVIHEVYEEGAAARDGRLWAGDQILEVNGVNLRSVDHEEAISTLRQTPAIVRLTVLRDQAQYRQEDNLDLRAVELHKRTGRGLGLSIVGKRSGSGVFIAELVKGGAAELDGRLMQGDQILSVDGEDMRQASQEKVAAILKVGLG